MDGEGMQVSFTLQSMSSKRLDWYFEKGIKQQRLINIQGWALNLNWSDKKGKTSNWHGWFEISSMFQTSVHCFFLSMLCT